MSDMGHDVRTAINQLVETCRDGQYGFEEAAKGVGDPALRAELMQYSMQRREFATALQQALRTMGEEPQDSGSLSATLHRGWIKVKEAISSNDDHAILSECERGEDAAVEAYREVMGEQVPPGVDDLVETQYSAVRHVHDRIRSLREASKPVH
jgi:uncharacterized protein (TIGR02284 family)